MAQLQVPLLALLLWIRPQLNSSPSRGDQAQPLLIPGRWFPARPLNYSDSYILPQEPWGTSPFTGEPRHPQPLAFTLSPRAAPV